MGRNDVKTRSSSNSVSDKPGESPDATGVFPPYYDELYIKECED